MRKLPIFFLLDVSESMIGAPLTMLEEGMSKIVSTLRRDPSALETVHISVIAFAGKAEVISPLTDLVTFYAPRLPIGGGTSLGAALDLLTKEIDTKIVKQTKTVQGDWKPIVFLLTDGQPTDNPKRSMDRWIANYKDKVTLVAITLGDGVSNEILLKLTPNVLKYEGKSEDDFKKFIDWVSESVKVQSQKADQGKGNSLIDLTKSGGDLKKITDPHDQCTDTNTIVLTGKCHKQKKPYLIKYSKESQLKSLQRYTKSNYNLEGCFPVTQSYFDWSSADQKQEINTNELIGTPGCPYCGALSAIAVCGNCQKIMCIEGEGEIDCPWCDKTNNFIFSEGDFDIQRGQG